MIKVFKTSVEQTTQAKRLCELLRQHFPGSKVDFDLDDCDKVLRIEGKNLIPEKVMMLVKGQGFTCRVLE